MYAPKYETIEMESGGKEQRESWEGGRRKGVRIKKDGRREKERGRMEERERMEERRWIGKRREKDCNDLICIAVGIFLVYLHKLIIF